MDSEPKTTPFEALGWKFSIGDMVVHRSNRFTAGLVVGLVAIYAMDTSPGFCRAYHVRTGFSDVVQVAEGELVRVNPNSWWLKGILAEPTGGDS